MDEQEKLKLFQRAITEYKDITPCTGKTWDECFIEYKLPSLGQVLCFYFNTADHSTRMITSKNLR